MDYVAAPEIIEKLWNASSGAPNTGTRWDSAASLIQRIASTGWASLPDVEDLLYEMDQTVGDHFHRRVEDLAQVFHLHFRAVFDRPKATTGMMIGGTTSLLAADCAQLLICLEAAGLKYEAIMKLCRSHEDAPE